MRCRVVCESTAARCASAAVQSMSAMQRRASQAAAKITPEIATGWQEVLVELEDMLEGLEAVPNPSGEGTIQVERGPFHEGIRPPSLVYTVSWSDQFKDVDLSGFNCYLPDWEVPGTPEQVAADKSLDDILAL